MVWDDAALVSRVTALWSRSCRGEGNLGMASSARSGSLSLSAAWCGATLPVPLLCTTLLAGSHRAWQRLVPWHPREPSWGSASAKAEVRGCDLREDAQHGAVRRPGLLTALLRCWWPS